MEAPALGAAGLGAAGLGAAATAAAAQSLWSYNRDNFMFDVPLRQARSFQMHNIQLARFALFREDVRDMAALTIDKVRGYMVIIALKLGFIVGLVFKFNRVDLPMDHMNHEERSINMLFTITLATSLFWLVTSMWFSMHALILARSLMTKMLVQVVRVPMPSSREIAGAASGASSFERRFAAAFRVPFISRSETFAAPAAQAGPRAPPATAVPPPDLGRGAKVNCSMEELLSAVDLLDVAASSTEPHIKMFKLVRASWENFDLYGKLSTELGTVCFLSGLAYVGIFYLRIDGFNFGVQRPAWFMFVIVSALAWWSTMLDMILPASGHLVLAFVMLGGPACMIAGNRSLCRSPWVFFAAFSMQTTWVLALSWCAFAPGGRRPHAFRASLYLNVLHHEEQPPKYWKDVRMRIRDCADGANNDALSPPEEGGAMSECDAETSASAAQQATRASLTAVSSDETEHWGARRAAGPVMRCLDAVLSVPEISRSAKRPIREARDELYEGCRAASVRGSDAGYAMTVDGFWLDLGDTGGDRRSRDGNLLWVSPQGSDPGDGAQQQDAVEIMLEDFLSAAHSIARMLQTDAQLLTAEDIVKLEGYGGETLPGVRSFLSQFRLKKGSDDTHPVGLQATTIFRGGVVLVTALWLTALVWSWKMTLHAAAPTSVSAVTGASIHSPARRLDVNAAAGDRVAFHAPLWMAAGALGCDREAELFAVASEAGVSIIQANGTRIRRGLSGACGISAVVGADFGPDGRLWIACADGRLMAPRFAGGVSSGAASGQRSEPFGAADLRRGLQAWAVDAAPAARGGHKVQALAVSAGRVLAVRSDRAHGWLVASTLVGPQRAAALAHGGLHRASLAGAAGAGAARWTAVAMRAGRGLALDGSASRVWEVDAASGRWWGPARMPTKLAWRGVCILPGDRGWLAVGHPADGSGGGMEMWRFKWQSPA